LKDYSNYHTQSKDKIAHDANKIFQMHLDGAEGKFGLIDGIQHSFVLQKHVNQMSEFKESNKIMCKSEVDLKRGSIVECEGLVYIAMSDVNDNSIYKDAEIIKTNNTLRFYNENKNLCEVPCIFSNINIGTGNSKFINLSLGHYLIFISSGYINKTKFDYNLRFILNDSSYKVEGISNSINGLLKIELVDDEFTDDDNRELGIANYYSNQPIDISTGNNIIINILPLNTSIVINKSISFTAKVLNNGIEDSTKSVIWSLRNSDESINVYANIIQNGNNCILTAGLNINKFIKLKCTLDEDNQVYVEREIRITNVF